MCRFKCYDFPSVFYFIVSCLPFPVAAISYFRLVASPPLICRSCLLMSKITFTSLYNDGFTFFNRSLTSLCTIITKWSGTYGILVKNEWRYADYATYRHFLSLFEADERKGYTATQKNNEKIFFTFQYYDILSINHINLGGEMSRIGLIVDNSAD